MSCGPYQSQQNAHRPNSLNDVSTRSNQWSRESSIARAILNACGFQEITTKTRHGQKHFCYTGNFCGKRCYSKQQKRKRYFLRRSKKSVFFFWKGDFKKKKTNSKHDERTSFLFRCQMTEIQKIYSWSGVKHVFLRQKKRSIYLVWKNKIEKKHKKKSETNQKGDRTKKVLQKGMNKWKRSFFPKKNEKWMRFKKKRFREKINKHKLKKHGENNSENALKKRNNNSNNKESKTQKERTN